MKRTTKKITIATALLCGGLLAGVGFGNVQAQTAYAAEAEKFFEVKSVALRLPDEQYGEGIRFTIVMDETTYAEENVANLTTGILLIPNYALGSEELVVDSTNEAMMKVEGVSWTADEGVMKMYVHLYNIPDAEYATDVAIRAYVDDGDATTAPIYTDVAVSSVAKAADWLYENDDLTEEEKATLQANYLTYDVFFHNGEEVTSIKGVYGEKITAPTSPEKAGYEFKGWWNEAGTAQWDFATTTVGGVETNLYVKWDLVTYQATIIRADGTQQTVSFTINDRASVLAGISLTADDAQYTYTWATALPSELALNNDQVFKETRTVNNYTVTFETDGGSAVASQTVPYGTPASALAGVTTSKAGYKFVKWQVLYGESYVDIPVDATVTGNMTVKAVWEKEIVYYNVKYFGYNGAEIKAETIEEGEKLTAPEAPNLYNAKFVGWYDEDLSVEWNFEQDTVEAETKLYATYTRTDATATEFESFNSELSLASVKASNNGAVAYSKDEIDGVKGSAKFIFKAGNSSAYVIPRQNLTGYDYISFKLYIPSENAHTDRYIVSGGVDYFVGANEWATITVPVSSIISSIDGNGYANLFMLVNDDWSGDFFATHRATWEEVVIYLADVNYVKATTPADNVIVDFADGSAIATAQASYKSDDSNNKRIKGVLTSKDVGGHTGAKLAYSIINEDGWNPMAKVKPAFDKAHYEALGYTEIKVTVYVPVSENATAGSKKKFPVCRANSGWADTQVSVGEWAIISYSLNDFFDRYDASTGYTSLFMVQIGDNKFANTDFYIGGITAQKAYNNRNMSLKEDGVIWYANTDNSPQGFRAYTSLVYFDGVYAIKCEMGTDKAPNNNKLWLPIDDNGEVVDVEARKAEWRTAGYTKVQIRCYIPSTNLSQATKDRGSKTILFNADPDMTVYDQKFVPLDQWYTYEMDFDAFWSRYNTTYKLMALFGAYNTDIPSANPAEYCDEDFVIYFDSIRLA